MRRRMFTFLNVFSAAIAVCAVALLVRSLFVWDRLNVDRSTDLGSTWRRQWVRLDSSAGRLDVNFMRQIRTNRAELAYLTSAARPFWFGRHEGVNRVPTANAFLRFVGLYGQVEDRPNLFFVRVVVPYWLIALVFGVAPAWRIYTARRRRAALRQGQNRCPNCEYDLRATPDRCPECGTIPASPLSPARAVLG